MTGHLDNYLSEGEQRLILEESLLGSICNYVRRNYNEFEHIKQAMAKQYIMYSEMLEHEHPDTMTEQQRENKKTIDDFFLTYSLEFREYLNPKTSRPLPKKTIFNPPQKIFHHRSA
ncbi:MAG: hypothetical protein ACLFTH_03500 [Candidatus Woesearchaeota archaeon]